MLSVRAKPHISGAAQQDVPTRLVIVRCSTGGLASALSGAAAKPRTERDRPKSHRATLSGGPWSTRTFDGFRSLCTMSLLWRESRPCKIWNTADRAAGSAPNLCASLWRSPGKCSRIVQTSASPEGLTKKVSRTWTMCSLPLPLSSFRMLISRRIGTDEASKFPICCRFRARTAPSHFLCTRSTHPYAPAPFMSTLLNTPGSS
mmetsp:Transcript_37747/g.106708  ORF Transcript_37747/g.106708 Transcript_37747/m.106708 type:complete len:203 (-) Transcript_37747:4-612(-)